MKPAFWTDKEMGRLPPVVRLDFIGLWMLADDAGWIEAFDVEQAAAELYPWESTGRRARRLTQSVAALAVAGRIVIHEPCGCLEVPHLAEHQRIAGRQSFGARDAHRKHSVATRSDGPLAIAPERRGIGTERNVEVRNGSARAARDVERVGDGRLKAELEARGLHLEGAAS
ncbi:MAG TPA: hypothetical protein VFW92_08540 [Candidatus Limnocylindrales bacterium]|nr:hypothetical protein [Candidatus Limnocylindrales bacterium]